MVHILERINAFRAVVDEEGEERGLPVHATPEAKVRVVGPTTALLGSFGRHLLRLRLFSPKSCFIEYFDVSRGPHLGETFERRSSESKRERERESQREH